MSVWKDIIELDRDGYHAMRLDDILPRNASHQDYVDAIIKAADDLKAFDKALKSGEFDEGDMIDDLEENIRYCINDIEYIIEELRIREGR